MCIISASLEFTPHSLEYNINIIERRLEFSLGIGEDGANANEPHRNSTTTCRNQRERFTFWFLVLFLLRELLCAKFFREKLLASVCCLKESR